MPRPGKSAPRFAPTVVALEERLAPAAGALDLSFNGTGKQTVTFDPAFNNVAAYAVAVQPDGKLVVVGSALRPSAVANSIASDFAVTRLNSDGSLDTSFNGTGRQTVSFDPGPAESDSAVAVAIRPDGKLVVAGNLAHFGGPGRGQFGVARLNPNGGLDATFDGDGKQTVSFATSDTTGGFATGMALQADGKVVVVGTCGRTVGANVSRDFAVARLNEDGSLDTSFDGDGRQSVAFDLGGASPDTANAVAVQADGKIVVAGSAGRGDFMDLNTDFAVARLNPDGSLDTTFDGDGKQTVPFDLGGRNADTANAVAIQADGKVVLGGTVETPPSGIDTQFAVVRLNADGGLDTTFNSTGKRVAVDQITGPFAETKALALQADGKIIVAGNAYGPASIDFALVRLNPDGDFDASFGGGGVTIPFDLGGQNLRADKSYGLAIQPDGNIVLVGSAQVTPAGANYGSTIAIARLIGDPTPNRPPVARDDVAVTAYGTPVTVKVVANDTDPDGDTLAVTVTGSAAHGAAVSYLAGTVTYTPAAGYSGPDAFTYAVSDGHGGTSSAAVTVTVGAASPVTPPVVPPVVPPAVPPATPPAVPPATPPVLPPVTPPVVPPSLPPVVPPATPPVVPPVVATPKAFRPAEQFTVGLDRGGDGTVRLQNPDQSQRFAVAASGGSGAAGSRTASADFNGDGVADLVVGTGPGGATRVRVLDGKTQAELFAFDPFEASFTGGVYVAAGDVSGDGLADLVVTPDEGGGPRVRVFSGAGFGQLADFFGIDDPAFRGGARAAVADINGDGVGDLIVSAGFGGGPRVAGFDGTTLGRAAPVKLFADFLAFEPALRNGVFVAGGDLNGDGFAELIAGGGPGGGPRVRALDGKSLLGGNAQTEVANFFAGDPANRGGVRLAVKDLDGDGRADLLTGAGPGGGSRVTAYAGKSIAANGTPPELFAFDAQPGFSGGVFVG